MRKNFFRTTFMGLMITFGTNAETATTNAPASQISSPGAPVIQIPTTNYVQEYLRTYTENPDLELNNVGANKIASEKYIMSAIDLVNDGDTDYAADARENVLVSMSYLESAVQRVEVCPVPWANDTTPEMMTNLTPGLTWQYYQDNLDTQLSTIVYGNNIFVAQDANYSGKLLYSTDAITWYETNIESQTDYFHSIIYDNNKFIAINRKGHIFYSTDGIQWKQTEIKTPSSSTTAVWGTIAYDGIGKYVTVATDGTTAYSTDGLTWTMGKKLSVAQWHHVVYGNGYFIAIQNYGYQGGTPYIAYSTDGISWATYYFPYKPTDYTYPVYNDGLFLIPVSWQKLIYSSDNGKTWTETRFIGGMGSRIACNKNICITAPVTDEFISYSIDGGRTWTQTKLGDGYEGGLVYANEKFIVSPFFNDITFITITSGTWAVGENCDATATTVESMCSPTLVGGNAICEESECYCQRTHLTDGAALQPNANISPIPVPGRTFESNDACNLQCAEICADNAVNNTDGAQKAILCGK